MKPKTSVLMDIYSQSLKSSKWTKTLPNEISDAFFDNPLTDGLHETSLILARAYFGEEWIDLVESVVWLDELTAMRPITFTRENGEKMTVSSMEQLCDYLVEFEGWEK